jgi:hypothetical protein
MVDLIAVHSVLVELHGGMLTLAAVCILATVIARISLRTQKTSEKNGSFWPMDSSMGKIARYTEPTAYLAGIGGVIGLIASAIIGFFIWPIELVTTSALALSKIMFSVFALILFIIFVLIRSKYGANLWKNAGMATVYACLGLLGFLLVVLAGSLGAHMALKGSILDPIYTLLGINPITFGFTGLTFVIVFVSIAIVEIAVPAALVLYLQQRTRPKDSATA